MKWYIKQQLTAYGDLLLKLTFISVIIGENITYCALSTFMTDSRKVIYLVTNHC